MTDNAPQEPENPSPAPKGGGSFVYWVVGTILVLLLAGGIWFSLPAQEQESIAKSVEHAFASDTKDADKDAAHLKKDAKADEKDIKVDAAVEEKDLKADATKDAGDVDVEWDRLVKDASRDETRSWDDFKRDLANDGEMFLSDARIALKELADQPIIPVPVETVEKAGDFQSALPEVQTPMQTEDFPDRPAPFLESKDNPYFGRGVITRGFHSVTGAWWQPQYFIYGNFRSGVQTLNTGVAPRTAEWVNRLDIYGNINLTPTERILVGMRPLDTQNSFSGYSFGPTPQPLDAVNGRITTLFFEGNSLSLFPSLDNMRDNWFDVDFTVGRQELCYQDGILLNDYVDVAGATRASTFFLGSSASKMSMVAVWDNIHRTDSAGTNSARAFGWICSSDYPTSTVEADAFLGTAEQSEGGDGVYGALSAVQRFGKINATFRLLGSHSINGPPGNVETVGNGALLFSQLSTKPDDTQNILYLDTYVGPGRFTSVSRSFDVGGPLSATGLLYASTQLGHFGAAISPYPNDSTGFALGYQMFLDSLDNHQLTFELGASGSTHNDNYKAGAMAVQYQRSFAQHFIWTVGGVTGVQTSGTTIWGVRTEISVTF